LQKERGVIRCARRSRGEVDMVQRTSGQMSLAEAIVHPGLGVNAQLERIGGLIDWRAVADVLAGLRRGERGAPPYGALLMFKALLLQQWYGLSDPALEEALTDRLSFRRFVGLDLAAATPDHTTLWRFREALQGAGLADALFAEINRQFDARGLMLKCGTLLDASLVEAQAAAPPPAEQQPAAAGDSTPAPSRLLRSCVDPDADWTRRGRRHYFGYKAHIGADAGSALIRTQHLTPASVNETVCADALVCGDERAVYADMAYDTKERRRNLRTRGIKDRIMHRPNKHHRVLPPWQARRNRLIARVRSRVETLFAIMKRHYHYRRVRYFTLARNRAQFALLCTAINLRRAIRLAP
jgi:IS5 family transposase